MTAGSVVGDAAFRLRLFARVIATILMIVPASWLAARGAARADPATWMRAEVAATGR